MELDYYHEKRYMRAASRVARRLNIYEHRKLGGRLASGSPKKQSLTFVLENHEKSAVKHSIEKHILLNFVNLSTFFCARF